MQAPKKLPATWLAAGNQWQCRTTGKWGKSDGFFHWGQLPRLEVGGRDAEAVVGDLEPLLAVGLEADLDGRGAGVEAVLDELLHGGGEVEDDLAGADAVHHRLAYGLDRRRGIAAPASSPSSSHSSLNPTPRGGGKGLSGFGFLWNPRYWLGRQKRSKHEAGPLCGLGPAEA